MSFFRKYWIQFQMRKTAPVGDLILASGSDNSHAKSLLQWLNSAIRHEPNTDIVIYDLGLTVDQRKQVEALQSLHSRLEIRTFRFENYPAYFDIKVAAGEYAWKPTIIDELAMEFTRPICWMDAGNLIKEPLTFIKKMMNLTGFYSPSSKGTVEDWTHPLTLHALNYPKETLNETNLNGACIAFNPRISEANALLERWSHTAKNKDIIAPWGSSRSNHRQDQATLSALYYLSPLSHSTSPHKLLRLKKVGFVTHQDVDTHT
jgi:hypothetical protein